MSVPANITDYEFVLRVVDIETTGMEPPEAEVIEIGWQDVCRTSHDSWVFAEDEHGSMLFSCDKPCPPEVMAVHHILPWEIKDEPRFEARPVQDRIECKMLGRVADVFVAHNAKFEASFLGGFTDRAGATPARWLCTYKAALRVWPNAPDHKNQTLLYWLGLHNDIDEERRHPPHRAEPDAYVTAHILLKLLEHATVRDMVAWTLEPPVMPTCPIGKFRGKPWAEVEGGFLNWMLNQPTMEEDLKWNARRELDRRQMDQRGAR